MRLGKLLALYDQERTRWERLCDEAHTSGLAVTPQEAYYHMGVLEYLASRLAAHAGYRRDKKGEEQDDVPNMCRA